jgi:hypothetical protein
MGSHSEKNRFGKGAALTPDEISSFQNRYLHKIKVLSETVWEGKANGPAVREWLSNFTGLEANVAEEQLNMLYLLTQFMYYGRRETRALLEAVYYDLFRRPLIARIRRDNGNTRDVQLINSEFVNELSRTRFVGIGGPADSGSMLLYDLRKQLQLSDSLFATVDAILAGRPEHCPPNVSRYVFIDDLCGSGDEASDFDAEYVEPIRRAFGPDIEIDCFVLFATSEALRVLRPPSTSFTRVEALHELDGSFRSLSPNSRYFPASPMDRILSRRIAERYGISLFRPSLGHGNCELLLGFNHNVPDNTLPIVWSREVQWKPIFERR